MANVVEKVKSLVEKEQQQSLSWVDTVEILEVGKDSLWRIAPWIFTGVKELSNIGL